MADTKRILKSSATARALLEISEQHGHIEDEYQQVDAIPLAEDFVEHWRDLLLSSPRSIVGPLASLLTDVRRKERDLLKKSM